MEKFTMKENPFFRKVVAGYGPSIRGIKIVKPPTTISCTKGVWTYKRLN
uniref:4c accessory protein n=2 Tax=Avian coronavirus TaxID=694014 RepID=A0A291B668_9GAMC|nr:4c accessory protein [Avian coronavirus]ATE90986.1 4c accessory protein [Avian coronavirus]QKV27974.1 putative 4c protein [Infectious bronchitis virus]